MTHHVVKLHGRLIPIAVLLATLVFACAYGSGSAHSVLASKMQTAALGGTLTIKDGTGGQVSAKLIRVIDPAHATGPFASQPASGYRFVGTVFHLVSNGSSAFASADSVISIYVVGSDAKHYDASSVDARNTEAVEIAGCQNFTTAPVAALKPGQSITACVAIEMPIGVKVVKIGYEELAPGTGGEWTVP